MTTRTTRDLKRLMESGAERRAARARFRSLDDISPGDYAEQVASRHLEKLPADATDARRAEAWQDTAEALAELVDVLVGVIDPATDEEPTNA